MTELLTAAQMRAIEQSAIDSGKVTGRELMERAGQGIVAAILDWRRELAIAPCRAVVLCGPGNNGGDGFVVARLLHQRGWEVEVFLFGDAAKLPPDAAENAARWREIGDVKSIGRRLPDFSNGDVVIDALFGTGLTRPLPADILAVIDGVRRGVADGLKVEVVAVDIASGICSDSGAQIGDGAFDPDLTVSFHRAKLGHWLMPSAPGGALKLVDIGIEPWQRSFLDHNQVVRMTELPVAAARAELLKVGNDHKYSHGHALILSGGVGKGGAARLAARGALRIGAGLVTIGCPPAAVIENAARLDAIMLASIKGVDGLQTELRQRKVKAVCIGPGFGKGERLRAFIAALLDTETRVVLDADALSEYSDDPGALFAMLHQGCILTPHEGEFGRLFPDILDKLNTQATTGPAYSKVDATREAAKRAGCVVLFKGADTVIADPAGRCAINPARYERAAPWLATAGSGDVLAGFITGLLARGFDPMQAAEIAAWLHVECALTFGPGLIAEDLPEQLPAVFRDLDP